MNPYDEMDIDTKKKHALFLHNDMMADILSEKRSCFFIKVCCSEEEGFKKGGSECEIYAEVGFGLLV